MSSILYDLFGIRHDATDAKKVKEYRYIKLTVEELILTELSERLKTKIGKVDTIINNATTENTDFKEGILYNLQREINRCDYKIQNIKTHKGSLETNTPTMPQNVQGLLVSQDETYLKLCKEILEIMIEQEIRTCYRLNSKLLGIGGIIKDMSTKTPLSKEYERKMGEALYCEYMLFSEEVILSILFEIATMGTAPIFQKSELPIYDFKFKILILDAGTSVELKQFGGKFSNGNTNSVERGFEGGGKKSKKVKSKKTKKSKTKKYRK
jgi:hypothetical protein